MYNVGKSKHEGKNKRAQQLASCSPQSSITGVCFNLRFGHLSKSHFLTETLNESNKLKTGVRKNLSELRYQNQRISYRGISVIDHHPF